MRYPPNRRGSRRLAALRADPGGPSSTLLAAADDGEEPGQDEHCQPRDPGDRLERPQPAYGAVDRRERNDGEADHHDDQRPFQQHTGSKGSYGHRHKEQEEIYFVVSGKLQFKLGDEIVEAGRGTAVRVSPEVVRGVWNDEPEDAELVIVSRKIDDPRADGEIVDDFWPGD